MTDDFSIDLWKDKANNNPVLRDNNIKVVNSFWLGFLEFILIVFIIGAVCFFLYMIYDGKLKTEINDNSTYECNCPEIPQCPNMQCPSVNCPSLSCGVVNVTFPNNLTLNIENGS